MSKHTPGPWSFNPYSHTPEEIEKLKKHGMEPTRLQSNNAEVFVMAAEGRVAQVDPQTSFKRGQGWQHDCEERNANARLIAAAPDLLAALKAQDDPYLEPHERAALRSAAIAKAESGQ